MKRRKLEIMIVAGEDSGDSLGAKIVDEIRHIEPDSRFYGAAGSKMAASGVEPDFDIGTWSVTGVIPVALSVPAFLSRLRQITKLADERRPDAILLIDFPEFNLKLAKALKKRGHKVVYYVSPQLWAWRGYRAQVIKKYVDLLISILPFEKQWYADRGIENVAFVGNPVIDRIQVSESKEEICERLGLDAAKPIIAMLPGSRTKELRFHLPIMIAASQDLKEIEPQVQVVFAAAGPKQRETIKRFSERTEMKVRVFDGETHNILRSADAAAVSSGTATLEAGILGTPMAIVYRMSKIDAAIIGPLLNVRNVGLINLIAGKRIVTELVQDEFTARALGKELRRLMIPEVNIAMRGELRSATEKLGENASTTAAELVVKAARGFS